MSQPLDIQGRAIGGLLEACNATNKLHMQRRLEYRYMTALETGGKSLAGTGLILHGDVLCAPHLVLNTLTGDSNVINQISSINKQTTAANGEEEILPEKKRRKKGGRPPNSSHAAATATTTTTTTAPPSAPNSPVSAVQENPSETTSAQTTTVPAPTSNVGSGRKGKQAAELYCVCKTPWTEDRFMIGCDGQCEDWFHPECLGYLSSKKRDTTLVDVDGIKISNIDNYSFFCPRCELTRGSMGYASDLSDRKGAPGPRFFRWCDVVDVADGCEGVNDEWGKDISATIRWRLLMQARNEARTTGPCAVCRVQHHPLLPCPSPKTDGEQHHDEKRMKMGKAAEEQEIPEDFPVPLPVKINAIGNNDTYALVVGGKYQGMQGIVVSCSRKWFCVDISGGKHPGKGRIIVPHNHLLVSKSKSFGEVPKAEQNEDEASSSNHQHQTNYMGVMPSGSGFIAYLDLDPNTRIILGKFVSPVRAARVHDVAKRLQFGEDNLMYDDLNFPDATRFISPAPVKNQEPTELDQFLALAHQIAIGPFTQSSSHGNDAMHVLEWGENMLAALETIPPYIQGFIDVLETIIHAVAANAEDAAITQASYFDKIEFSVDAPEQDEEDELEAIMKKYSRSRSAKQTRQRNS